jgi:hypothetical protein
VNQWHSHKECIEIQGGGVLGEDLKRSDDAACNENAAGVWDITGQTGGSRRYEGSGVVGSRGDAVWGTAAQHHFLAFSHCDLFEAHPWAVKNVIKRLPCLQQQ